MPNCPNHLRLSQWALGEIAPDEHQSLAAHVQSCSRCTAELGEIQRNLADYQSHAAREWRRLQSRMADPTPPTGWQRWRLPVLSFASVAAAASLAVILLPSQTTVVAPEVRFKGAVSLQVVAARGVEQFEVKANASLHAGDALRLVLAAGTPGQFGAVLVDAMQARTWLYPDPTQAPRAPFKLSAAGTQPLADSFVLDASLGAERLVWLFCEPTVSGAELLRALESDDALAQFLRGAEAELCHHGVLPFTKVVP